MTRMFGNDPPSLGSGVAGEIRMTKFESVQSVTSVVLSLLIRVYSCPFVVASSFHLFLRKLRSEVLKNLQNFLTTNGH
jgi:hypothetical protein